MTEITEFLENRLAQDTETAEFIHRDNCDLLDHTASLGTPCNCGYPKRALAEIAAKRAIIGLHKVQSERERKMASNNPGFIPNGPLLVWWVEGPIRYWCDICDQDRDHGHTSSAQEGCDTLRSIASVYSDHPDYQSEWAV